MGMHVGGEKMNFMIVSEDVSTCLYLEILAHQDGVSARYFTEPSVALHAYQSNPAHWSLVIVDKLSPLITEFSLVGKIKAVKPDTRLMILATHAPEAIKKVFKCESLCGLCHVCNDVTNSHCFFLHKPFYRDFDRVIETALGKNRVGLAA
jgi:response regulator RpfG family c-di-GMP phosphodiesterase